MSDGTYYAIRTAVRFVFWLTVGLAFAGLTVTAETIYQGVTGA